MAASYFIEGLRPAPGFGVPRAEELVFAQDAGADERQKRTNTGEHLCKPNPFDGLNPALEGTPLGLLSLVPGKRLGKNGGILGKRRLSALQGLPDCLKQDIPFKMKGPAEGLDK